MAEIFWAKEIFQDLTKKREEYDAETDKQVQDIVCSCWAAEQYLKAILIELVKIRRDTHRP